MKKDRLKTENSSEIKNFFRKNRVISRLLCYFGVHKMIIGLGWSGDKRLDSCYHCKYSILVQDIEGSKKIDDELQKYKIIKNK